MMIKSAEFVTSVSDSKQCKDYGIPEIAVAGKSNVGKSSFINLIANVNRLAKTSSTPGRTRLLNYFNLNRGEFLFVDLPGYGYARVPDQEKAQWAELIEGYLQSSKQLKCVLVLVDVRHEPGPLDKQMIAYLHHYSIPFLVIATKCDKLSKAQVEKQKRVIAQALAQGTDNIIAVSVLNKSGKERVLERIENMLNG